MVINILPLTVLLKLKEKKQKKVSFHFLQIQALENQKKEHDFLI